MITRTKCISNTAYPDAPKDSQLIIGKFYDVIDYPVYTMHSPDPWISVSSKETGTIQRPRHLFGPILKNKDKK